MLSTTLYIKRNEIRVQQITRLRSPFFLSPFNTTRVGFDIIHVSIPSTSEFSFFHSCPSLSLPNTSITTQVESGQLQLLNETKHSKRCSIKYCIYFNKKRENLHGIITSFVFRHWFNNQINRRKRTAVSHLRMKKKKSPQFRAE